MYAPRACTEQGVAMRSRVLHRTRARQVNIQLHIWSVQGMQRDQLHQFLEEVSTKGAEAVLPQHLSDAWLAALLEEGNALTEGESEEEPCAGLLAAVLKILDYQSGAPFARGEPLEVSTQALLSSINYYVLCLAMEEVSRRTDIKAEPPTLDNMFQEDREVAFSRVPWSLEEGGEP